MFFNYASLFDVLSRWKKIFLVRWIFYFKSHVLLEIACVHFFNFLSLSLYLLEYNSFLFQRFTIREMALLPTEITRGQLKVAKRVKAKKNYKRHFKKQFEFFSCHRMRCTSSRNWYARRSGRVSQRVRRVEKVLRRSKILFTLWRGKVLATKTVLWSFKSAFDADIILRKAANRNTSKLFCCSYLYVRYSVGLDLSKFRRFVNKLWNYKTKETEVGLK